MQPAGPLFHKPKSIVAATNILYATLFLGIIKWLIGQFSIDRTGRSSLVTIVTVIVVLLIYFFLIKQIGAGKKWVRVVLLVLFIGGIAVYIWGSPSIFKANFLVAVISLLQTILQIIALVYLFSKDSTNWFDHVETFKKDEMLPSQPH
jgi:hypothetical protein